MKKLLRRIILSKTVARLVIRPLLRLHTVSFVLAGVFATVLNDGLHPKHAILRYKEWFLGKIQSGWVVLDVGCNTGMMPNLLATKARFVYGIEINPKLVAEANEKWKQSNIQFICGDATCYDYRDCKEIDCVTLSNVLEHIRARPNFLRALADNINWKNPADKRFLIRVPMIDREWIVVYKKQMGLEYRLDRTHYIEYTLVGLRSELHEAGMQMASYEIKFGEIYCDCRA